MISADYAATTSWGGVQGKPSLFPPSAHTHNPKDIERAGAITGDVLTWDGKKYVPKSPADLDIVVETADGLAKLEEKLTVVVDDQKALVDKSLKIEARFKGSEALFNDRITALATETEASVRTSKELIARIGDAEAKIKRTEEVVVTKNTALARITESLSATVAKNNATITTIKQTYATREYAEAKISEAIVATTGVTLAELTTELSAYATLTFAEAKKTEAISAAALDATAKVLVETTARASADSAISSTVTTLTASVSANNASIIAEATARASADSAMASTLSSLSATVGANTSAISTETSARVSADSAISSTVSTLSSTVSGHTASISAEATTRATADGNLSAQYVFKVVAGRAAGFRVTSTTSPTAGDTSEIVFDATVFKIYDGSSGVAPFTVSGGVVQMSNAVVTGSLDIGSGINRTQINGSNVLMGSGAVTGFGSGGNYQINIGSPSNAAIVLNTLAAGSFAYMGTYESGFLTSTWLYNGQANFAAGTVGGPGIAFLSDGDTGWRLNATGDMRGVTSGSDRLVVRDAAIVCLVPLKLANSYVGGAPSASGYVTIQDASGATYKVLVGT